jgi:uracil phosphoribosyltransferase
MTELGRWLTYEAIRDWLPVIETQVQTPLGISAAKFINPEVPVAVIPILRAGLALIEGAQALLPLASVYHIGLARNEETLEPSWYLNKLPDQFDPNTRVLIPEPMLATGGTSLTVMEALTSRGIQTENIRFVSIVVAPVALQKLSEAYPALKIFTAAIDEKLDENGFIVPGLGDAGDRTFGTD